jgi:hypothetical protein
MSFLKSLFGRRGGDAAEVPTPAGEPLMHNGFTIQATPYKSGGEYQTAGVISKEIDGVRREHHFVRAERHASREAAIAFALTKGRQIIDERGEHVFD